MKYLLSLITGFIMVSSLWAQVSIIPEHPIPGDSVRFIYDRAFELKDSFDLLYVNGYWVDSDNQLSLFKHETSRINGLYTGMVHVPNNAVAMALGFCINGKEDNCDNISIYFPTYDPEGDVAIKGGNAGLASLALNDRVPDLIPSSDALFFIKEEVYLHPTQWNNISFLRQYVAIARPMEFQENMSIPLERFLNTLEAGIQRSERELNDLIFITRQTGQRKLASNLTEDVIEQYPKGFHAQFEVFGEFLGSRTNKTKEKVFESYVEQFKGAERLFFHDRMARELANENLTNNWDKFISYANQIKDPMVRVELFNSSALTLGGLNWYSERFVDLDKAELLLKEAIGSFKEFASVSDEQVSAERERDRQIRNQEYFSRLAFNYSLIQYKKGVKDQALRYGAMAVMNSRFEVVSFIERYVAYYEQVYGSERTLPLLRTLIRTNHATDRMKEHFILLSSRYVSSEREAYAELSRMEEEAQTYEKRDLFDEILEIPAPDFTATNLKGETVRLSDLRGKTVVIDFWASWHEATLTAFPGIQIINSTYDKDESIVFLSINTLERSIGREKRIERILKDGNYDFPIFLDDDENSIFDSFGALSLPYRVIIDPYGMIRFIHTKAGQNPIQLRDEIVLMIDVLQTGLQ